MSKQNFKIKYKYFQSNSTGSDVSVSAFQAPVRPEGGTRASSIDTKIKLSAILIDDLTIMEPDERLVFTTGQVGVMSS